MRRYLEQGELQCRLESIGKLELYHVLHDGLCLHSRHARESSWIGEAKLPLHGLYASPAEQGAQRGIRHGQGQKPQPVACKARQKPKTPKTHVGETQVERISWIKKPQSAFRAARWNCRGGNRVQKSGQPQRCGLLHQRGPFLSDQAGPDAAADAYRYERRHDDGGCSGQGWRQLQLQCCINIQRGDTEWTSARRPTPVAIVSDGVAPRTRLSVTDVAVLALNMGFITCCATSSPAHNKLDVHEGRHTTSQPWPGSSVSFRFAEVERSRSNGRKVPKKNKQMGCGNARHVEKPSSTLNLTRHTRSKATRHTRGACGIRCHVPSHACPKAIRPCSLGRPYDVTETREALGTRSHYTRASSCPSPSYVTRPPRPLASC